MRNLAGAEHSGLCVCQSVSHRDLVYRAITQKYKRFQRDMGKKAFNFAHRIDGRTCSNVTHAFICRSLRLSNFPPFFVLCNLVLRRGDATCWENTPCTAGDTTETTVEGVTVLHVAYYIGKVVDSY